MRSRWGGARGSWLIPVGVVVILSISPGVASSAQDRAPDSSSSSPSVPLRLPADHVYRHGAGADSSVVFSHQTHVAFAEGQCTACHPRPFFLLRGSPVPHHGEMDSGGSCGICHDGKKAFSSRDSAGCHTCHSGIRPQALAATGAGGAPSARPAPKPHTFPTGADSPGRVTFRHETHARGAEGCTGCHPKPFRMATLVPPKGGAMHEKDSCGSCHDGKKSFATDDPDACERCHKESGATR